MVQQGDESMISLVEVRDVCCHPMSWGADSPLLSTRQLDLGRRSWIMRSFSLNVHFYFFKLLCQSCSLSVMYGTRVRHTNGFTTCPFHRKTTLNWSTKLNWKVCDHCKSSNFLFSLIFHLLHENITLFSFCSCTIPGMALRCCTCLMLHLHRCLRK